MVINQLIQYTVVVIVVVVVAVIINTSTQQANFSLSFSFSFSCLVKFIVVVVALFSIFAKQLKLIFALAFLFLLVRCLDRELLLRLLRTEQQKTSP